MNIGIVFAMQEELDAFRKYFDEIETIQEGRITIYHVKNDRNQLYFLKCGVGKVNAAYATTKLLNYVKLDMLFNSGVAGGIDVEHGALVLGEYIVHHDFDVTAFSDYVRGQIPSLPLRFLGDKVLIDKAKSFLDTKAYVLATIASGDQFVVSQESLRAILKLYPSIKAIEMEAAAIAQVATLENIPFLVIRAISDVIGEPSQSENFERFLEEASKRSAALLYELVCVSWN